MNRFADTIGRYFPERARSGRRAAALLALLSAMPTMAADDGPLHVAAVNYPLAYFAERIGGDLVTVRFLAPPDGDPAFWEPDADAIQAYQEADLILLNGAGYAKWVTKVTLPRRRLVDTSRSIRDDYLPGSEGIVHSHGPQGDHSHAGTAFTTWLDPRQAIVQARAIETALSRARPDDSAVFATGLGALVADLEALDARMSEAFSDFRSQPLLASHPVYQYLARRYDLDLRSLLWEPDVVPDRAGWAELDTLLEERAARWMLWEDEPLANTRERLAERDVGIIVFRPAGNRPVTGDYLALMQGNVDAVIEAAGVLGSVR